MKTSDIIHGFCVTRVRENAELGGPLYELRHQKTGAELTWLARPDENKSFGIAFKTVPQDSTGVFHILEHSVLCGSEKYPIKDPFVELLKSSVNTFLNAMTYPDKTVYPFSSRNDKDFLNLLDIYLDAVLHPAITQNPAIFRQEGWRYEFGEDGTAELQGVVLNEMKGAYSSPDTVLDNAMNRLLYPDTPYRFEYGGYPADIPDLTYEGFMAMYRTFYHPSNARIMLVGSVQIEAVLAKIASFLDAFDRLEADFSIPYQGTIPFREEETLYEIGEEEDAAGKTIYATGYLLGTYAEKEKLYATSILTNYLAGDNESPLTKAILSKNLGQDFSLSLRDGTQEPCLIWSVRNTDRDKLPAIRETVEAVLRDCVEKGLDRDRLEASYSRFAFRARDKDSGFPRSLAEALIMLDSWLYGGDPALYLTVEETLNALEEKLFTGYFENLLKTALLENPNKAAVVLTPSKTLGAEKAAAERARVAKLQAAWSQEEIAQKREELAAVRRWQEEPDTPEHLATIPVLKLSDLDPTPRSITPALAVQEGITVLTHKNASPLVTMNLHFNATDLEEADLPLLPFLATLLGNLGTQAHSATAISLLLKKTVGTFGISPTVFVRKDGTWLTDFGLTLVFLKSREEEAADLAAELLTATDFTDLAALGELLTQHLVTMRDNYTSTGHALGAIQAGASLTQAGAIKERMIGLSRLRAMTALSKQVDSALSERLAHLAHRLFTRSRLTVSLSEAAAPTLWARVANKLPQGEPVGAPTPIAPLPVAQTGLTIPAPVGYAVRAAKSDKPFTGSAFVLNNILNFSYLWGEIRVHGGAYGCGFSYGVDGMLGAFSYRDPKPARSLTVYENLGSFLQTYLAENPDLTAPILAAWSAADPLLNTQTLIALAESRYFRGVTEEDVARVNRELLATDAAALLALLPEVELVAKSPVAVVVAGKELIDACPTLTHIEAV